MREAEKIALVKPDVHLYDVVSTSYAPEAAAR
jgi:hypothetical protein